MSNSFGHWIGGWCLGLAVGIALHHVAEGDAGDRCPEIIVEETRALTPPPYDKRVQMWDKYSREVTHGNVQ
jgi:hypothetical protein